MFDGLIVAGVFAAVYFMSWVSYLIFLVHVARLHGSQAMRDAAEAVKVFPGAALADAIARVLRGG
jgi:hypothetical protein